MFTKPAFPTDAAIYELANKVFDGRGAIGDALAQLGREIVATKSIEIERNLRPNSGERADERNAVLDDVFGGVFRLKRCR